MNPRVTAISGSLIREVAAKRKPGGIDLGLGEPSLMPNPVHLEAGMVYAQRHGLRYTVNAGDPHLRELIAAHYGYPHMRGAENVCVTTGSQEATYAVLKTVLDPARDELLVVEPAFPSYAKMAALEGVTVRTAQMQEDDDYAFDPERIEGALTARTRLIVICSPCNPTARVIRRAQVAALSEMLQRRGGEPVWVLHDEIYREQTFVEDAGYFGEVYPYTIVTNSLSKSNALTGLRLGWAIAPAEVAANLVKVHAWLTSCADTFAQAVARSVFEHPGGVREQTWWYKERHEQVVEALAAGGIRYINPEGSFYACMRLPQGMESLPAALDLADHHDVVAIPGIAFGKSFEGWLRLSWVSSPSDVRTGIERIAEYCSLRTM